MTHPAGAVEIDRLTERVKELEEKESHAFNEGLEAAAKVAENIVLAIIPDRCSTRESLKFQREKTAERIRALKSHAGDPSTLTKDPRP